MCVKRLGLPAHLRLADAFACDIRSLPELFTRAEIRKIGHLIHASAALPWTHDRTACPSSDNASQPRILRRGGIHACCRDRRSNGNVCSSRCGTLAGFAVSQFEESRCPGHETLEWTEQCLHTGFSSGARRCCWYGCCC